MKIISALLLLTFPIALSSVRSVNCSAESGEEPSGMSFSSDTIYEVDTPYQKSIDTFEAVISLPKSVTSDAGTILGSKGVTCGSLNFDITSNGVPRVYSVDLYKNENTVLFDKCDVRSDSKIYLAITNDSVSGTMNCYLNGELVQTKNTYISDYSYIKSSVLGGDWSDTGYDGNWSEGHALHEPEECVNSSYFRGTVYDVALYSSVRSESEIKDDILSVDDLNNDLFAHYELTGETDRIYNKAGSSYNINKRARHIKGENIPELKDYEYSMAILGDTQFTCQRYPEEFAAIFDDLRDHAADNKLKYVISMGDNCDQDTDTEWERVQEQYRTLDGTVGYAINQGNHESSGQINKYFSNDDYLSTLSGCFKDNKVENSYRFLSVGDVKYIIFTLEYGAGDDVLEWAGNICDSFPDRKVICTTHAYLTHDGTSLDRNDADTPTKEGAPNSGEDLWNNFFSQHENIVLVLCGHITNEDVLIRQEKGVNGNVVTSMLVDNQANDLYDERIDPETGEYVSNAPLGMIYYLYFSKDGSHVQARYYSPVHDEYLCYSNQREVTLYDGIDFEQSSMKGVTKDDNVMSVTFEKESYNVGDLVNFNVTLNDGYEVDSVLVNGEPALISQSEDYAYCYVAGEKDRIEVTSVSKLKYEPKDVPDGKKASFVLPIILLCVGAVLFGGAAAVLFKKKKK